MWHQQSSSRLRPSLSPTEDSDLATGRPRPPGTSAGKEISPSNRPEQQWNQVVSSPTTLAKDYSDSGLMSMYDSGLADSGFLSGANLASSECLSEEISPSQKFVCPPDSTSAGEKEHSSKFLRLDSGIDIGLSDQLYNLSCENISSHHNDLNVTPNTTHHLGLDANSFTNISISPKNTSNAFLPNEPLHPPHAYVQRYFQQDDDGDTQLHTAIVHGFVEVVCSLIRMAPSPFYLDILNDDCQTALHLAVVTRQPRIVRLLVLTGAKLIALDRNGNTALHLACHAGDAECFHELTEPLTESEINAANLQQPPTIAQQLPQDLEMRNYEGQTCLHLAAVGGHVHILRRLIKIGADVNAREAKSGRTGLHLAIERSIHEVSRLFLEECCIGPEGLQLETKTYDGYTAYQMARRIDSRLAQEIADRAGLTVTKMKDSDSDSDSSSDEG